MSCTQESPKHTENATLERAHSRQLHWSPRAQLWARDAILVEDSAHGLCGHRTSHFSSLSNTVTGPLKANLI